MIDFRYHLISIVAVLLALSCGVVLGSGLIGGPLLNDVRQRAEDVRETNEEVRSLADDRLQAIDRYRSFTQASMPYLIDGSLDGTEVLIVTADGTDEGVVDSFVEVINSAGGTVNGAVRLTNRLLLDDAIALDQLALIAGAGSTDAEELQAQTGKILGTRLAAAAASEGGPPAQRLDDYLSSLREADFISLDDTTDGALVSSSTVFLVVAGGAEEPAFPVRTVTDAVALELGDRGATIMVTEPAGSVWQIVNDEIQEGELARRISTAAGVEELPGQVAAVLGLARSLGGDAVHVGFGDTADAVLPSPPSETEETPDP